jgi:hypothetical protein
MYSMPWVGFLCPVSRYCMNCSKPVFSVLLLQALSAIIAIIKDITNLSFTRTEEDSLKNILKQFVSHGVRCLGFDRSHGDCLFFSSRFVECASFYVCISYNANHHDMFSKRILKLLPAWRRITRTTRDLMP